MRTSEQSHQRLEHLYEISELLVGFESVEKTFDRALGIAARTLPLASAVLIEQRDDRTRMIFWPSGGQNLAMLSAAKEHAERAFRYLVGTGAMSLDLSQQAGATELPDPASPAPDSIDRKRFIVLPLVVGGHAPFGALQLEGASTLSKADLLFVSAMANQLALALDRHHAWQRDITRRERAEQRQAGAEANEAAADERRLTAESLMERYQALVDNLDRAFVWEADADTLRMRYVSAHAESLLGHSRDRWPEEPSWWSERVHPEDRERLFEMFDRARAGRRDQRCEHRCFARDGTEVWLRTGVHLAGGDGEPLRFQGVSVDITSEKRAEQGLRDQLDFTRSMAASLGEGVVAIDVEGKVTFFNDAARVILGSAEGSGPETIRLERFFESALRHGHTTRGEEHRFVRADGETLALSYTASPIDRGGEVAGAVLALRDITDQVRADEERRFLLEASSALAATLEERSLIETLVRVGIPRLGDRCAFDEIRDDGEVRRAVSTTRVDLGAEDLPTDLGAKSLQSGESVVVRSEHGSWMAIPLSMGNRKLGALIYGLAESQRCYGAADVALGEELSRRAAFALENARLYQDQRLAVRLREQILGVVSHDLKNPLFSILMTLAVLERNDGPDQALNTGAVQRIRRAAEQMKRLINDLLDFASIQAGRFALERRPHDAASMLREVVVSHESIAEERHVRLTAEADPGLPAVLCDRDRILQVLSNLIGNALKVTRDGVVLVRAVPREQEVVFAISDSGPGIKEEDLAHLFERYWRGTDVEYKGTGLGLAIARGIVEGHGGRIWAESTPGEGATFFFTVPVHGDPASDAQSPARG
jgi:PAS domain S-box-containing protein